MAGIQKYFIMRRTKIICTVGPATSTPERLQSLVDAGMNVARLNFSHGEHAFHGQTIKYLRQISSATQKPLALMQDLCGPKIRLGVLPQEGITVEAGQEVTFVLQKEGKSADEIPYHCQLCLQWFDAANQFSLMMVASK